MSDFIRRGGGDMGRDKVWLRPWRVARRLDCSVEQVYLLARTGQLETMKLGPRALRISEESLQQFISQNLVVPSEQI